MSIRSLLVNSCQHNEYQAEEKEHRQNSDQRNEKCIAVEAAEAAIPVALEAAESILGGD